VHTTSIADRRRGAESFALPHAGSITACVTLRLVFVFDVRPFQRLIVGCFSSPSAIAAHWVGCRWRQRSHMAPSSSKIPMATQ
jgi:hypothetical protein